MNRIPVNIPSTTNATILMKIHLLGFIIANVAGTALLAFAVALGAAQKGRAAEPVLGNTLIV